MTEPTWRKHWPEFERALERKMDLGFIEYGDGSFKVEPHKLVEELQLEALDIVGWGFILWCRLEKLRQQARQQAMQLELPFDGPEGE